MKIFADYQMSMYIYKGCELDTSTANPASTQAPNRCVPSEQETGSKGLYMSVKAAEKIVIVEYPISAECVMPLTNWWGHVATKES